MGDILIRDVKTEDSEAVLKIYEYYIKNTAITFEYDVPSVSEFKDRIKHITEKYPYIVIENDEGICGYAYAGCLKDREAYKFSCEISIYLDKSVTKRGFGRLLYEALEKRLIEAGILNIYACIAYPENDDPYLDKNSLKFHEHMGFKTVGDFYKCGYKFDRWYNTVWMEKLVGGHK